MFSTAAFSKVPKLITQVISDYAVFLEFSSALRGANVTK